jgi:hypothetical protein
MATEGEVERLKEYLEASQATLKMAKQEVQSVRDQQVTVDSRVATKFLLRRSGSYISPCSPAHSISRGAELELELLALREAAALRWVTSTPAAGAGRSAFSTSPTVTETRWSSVSIVGWRQP